MTTITIPVSDNFVYALNQTPNEIAENMKLQYAAKLFQDGKITIGQGAEFCGIAFTDFMFSLGKMGIPVIDYSPEELDKELECLRARL
jgi:predicted HTH domain antitoxin